MNKNRSKMEQTERENFGNNTILSDEQGFDLENCMKPCDKIFKKFYKKEKDYYYDSYAHYGIHEEMIKDEVR